MQTEDQTEYQEEKQTEEQEEQEEQEETESVEIPANEEVQIEEREAGIAEVIEAQTKEQEEETEDEEEEVTEAQTKEQQKEQAEDDETDGDDVEVQSNILIENVDDAKPVVEAILFAADEPLTCKKILSLLANKCISIDDILNIINTLKMEYDDSGKGFQIEEVADGYQILSRSEYHEWVSKLIKKKKDVKLSHASLETLAIIAYKQPILRSDVEAIRGVQSGQMVRMLIDMGLVQITGRAEVIGRPLLYGTTKKFLQQFGISSIQDLPKVEN